ncbi:MAG TPA: xanthine dehydrogenase family protein molybdopterin-binding subunit [Burkholderiales bacterium]|nr:xanthine dehydrogenase family protein molybdopterin-binding subunit [Burkholderiales bacterium]
MNGKVFGRSVERLEDADLLQGAARFIDDIRIPGMLEAAFVRSPHAHAAIRGIDKSAALALPGVHRVFVLADLMPHLQIERLVVGLPSKSYKQDHHRPALAGDEVVHVGEPVAIVVADNRYVAEDGAALVEVDYDPLPAVADCRDALGAGAPRVHRHAPHNLLAEFALGYGDVDGAFGGAAHVLRESIWQHRGGSHSIECRGAVAVHDAMEDRLTLWSSTQMPHAAQRLLCDMLGRDENRVRVITPDVGGGFGPKLVFYPEDVVTALAALLVGRPLKWIEDRREHFVATTQERDQYWEAEIAVDGNARILGIRGNLIHDHGAYTARGVNLPHNSAETLPLQYEVPAYRMNVRVALTNKVPVTPVRGAGHPQGTFVIERLLDRVARELKLDRAEVRRRNLIHADKMPYTTQLKARGGMPIILDSGDYPKCQHQALAHAGWETFGARQQAARAHGRYLGIGLANYCKGTGRGPFEAVTVRIGPSGKVHVYSGAAAMGQSTRTMLAQIVAEQLGGKMENVTVTTGDTAAISMGMGGSNSRQTVIAGSSAHAAALKVRAKALKIASQMLDVAESDLEIEGDRIQATGMREKSASFGEIARTVAGTAGYALPAGVTPGLEATEHLVIDDMAHANGTAVVEVEVDAETGAVGIVKFIALHDCGRIINPMLVDGQILGGTAHGIGNALFEWMGYDDNAQPVTTNLGEYLLVTATEMPHIEILHHESPTPLNPLGVKGIGECGVIPVAAAIISAIEDALMPFGVHLAQAPISPAQIVALIEAARERMQGTPTK